MLALNADTDTEYTLRDALTLETVLMALGAAEEIEAVAHVIADSARQFMDAILVTLAVPSDDSTRSLVITSGGMTTDGGDDMGVDQLPVRIFSLQSEQHSDETLPLLRIHGESATSSAAGMVMLKRFAPHARLALMRARRLAQTTRLAYSDPLTSLANARGLRIALDREATRANAEARSLALLVIDLDDFRRYNTFWGHLVGDAALQAFARAIDSAMRGRHLVARVGGEEFAVLLPGADEHEACAVAADIHAAIAKGSGGLPSPFTASIGIGVYPNDVPDAFSLYAVADTAMTMAKRAGKNRTFLFETIGQRPTS
jgi:diguanylate cyclase (GGDEF)-like protein